MHNETTFDINRDHIHLELFIINNNGFEFSVDAILDTGAPNTEISNLFLEYVGFINLSKNKIEIKTGLETQKYSKVILPEIRLCGHIIKNHIVYVSQFAESWGIDALIGLVFLENML